jgi:hypothetical protein
MWLCQSNDGKYNCVWRSNVNHYVESYPKKLYE